MYLPQELLQVLCRILLQEVCVAYFCPVVHPVRALLAGRIGGALPLSDCLVVFAAVSNHWYYC